MLEEVPLAVERRHIEYGRASISNDGFIWVWGSKHAVVVKVPADKDAVFNWIAIVPRRGREDDLI